MDDDIEDIVATIAERMGVDGELALAAASLPESGDVNMIRQFVCEMEEPDLDAPDDDVDLQDDESLRVFAF